MNQTPQTIFTWRQSIPSMIVTALVLYVFLRIAPSLSGGLRITVFTLCIVYLVGGTIYTILRIRAHSGAHDKSRLQN